MFGEASVRSAGPDAVSPAIFADIVCSASGPIVILATAAVGVCSGWVLPGQGRGLLCWVLGNGYGRRTVQIGLDASRPRTYF